MRLYWLELHLYFHRLESCHRKSHPCLFLANIHRNSRYRKIIQRPHLPNQTLIWSVNSYWGCSLFWRLLMICCSSSMTLNWFFVVGFLSFTLVQGRGKGTLVHLMGLLKVSKTVDGKSRLFFVLSFWVFRSCFRANFTLV